VVRPREVDHLKCERLSAVVAHVSECDRQSDPSEGDRLLARDHSVEWMWAALELVLGKPHPLKGVEVHEVEAAAPIHEGFGEPGRPNQRVDFPPPSNRCLLPLSCLYEHISRWWIQSGGALGQEDPVGRTRSSVIRPSFIVTSS
jgi:hypothetical protein